MRQAFGELMAVAPRTMALWLLIVVPGTFVIALITSGEIREAAGLSVGALVAGVPLLGFMWLDPLTRATPFTWTRFAVALTWAAATAIPAIPIGILLVNVVRGVLP